MQKHGLTQKASVEGYAAAGEWITCCKADSCCGEDVNQDECSGDHFDIFGNEDNTHIVSVNRTKGLFRICHCEMLCMCSDWSPVEEDYLLQPLHPEHAGKSAS